MVGDQSAQQELQGADTVELVYQPALKDYASALRARMGISRAGKARRLGLGCMALMVVLEGLLALTGNEVQWKIMGWMAVSVTLLSLSPWLQARQLHRFAQQQGTFHATVADTGLAVRNANATINVNWVMQPRYRETPELFVLYSGDKNATGLTVLPKRGARHPADVDRLRAILDRNLTRV